MKLSKVFTLLAVFAVAAIVSLSSCKDDDSSCQTCTLDVLGTSITTEYCQNGDDVIATVNGVEQTIPNVTVEQATAGQTCN